MLSDTKLKSLKPQEKPFKVTDRDGLYVVVSTSGTITFRYDYRLHGRRETLTIGRYGDDALSLADAREALMAARKKVNDGISPAREKADGKNITKDTGTFATFAEVFLRDANLADSTKAMKRSIINRDIIPKFGKFKLEEITASQIKAHCDKIKTERDAPATAVHVREIMHQIYRHAQDCGLEIDNPASKIKASAIAKFKARDRSLTPTEIRIFFSTLDKIGTIPGLKLGIKFILLTMVRKGELIGATWPEVDFDKEVWTIPKERMKMERPHNVYLSLQALDILIALKTCAGSSRYFIPGRYDTDLSISDATLNRIITTTVERAQADGHDLEHFTVHDLRRTGSTLLHEAGFNSDWIEKCLAHEQKGVRAVYNKAEYADQRRDMLQQWADMVDGWIKGAEVVPLHSKSKTVA